MLPTHVLISESAGGWLRLDLSASCSSTSQADSQVSAWHKKSGVDTLLKQEIAVSTGMGHVKRGAIKDL